MLQTTSLLAPQINMRQIPKQYFNMIGPQECNNLNTPQSGGASNTTASFRVNNSSVLNCVLDLSSAQLSIPVTIVMTGSSGSGGNLYNPEYECFKAYPIHRIMQRLQIKGANATFDYQPFRLIASQECFLEDENNGEYQNTMIDMVCAYSQYDGMVYNPFAQRLDSYYITRNASCPITVVNNTFNSATIQATLITSLDMFPPFTSDRNLHGGVFDKLQVDIDYFANGLSAMWARSSLHPQNTLTSLAVTMGVASLQLTYLTMPNFVEPIPQIINYPYFETTPNVCNTTASISAGATFTVDTGSYNLNYTPSRVYFYCTVSDTERYATVTSSTQIPNFFSEIVSIGVQWNNSPKMYTGSTQMDLFEISKRNGLRKQYSFADWVGEYGGNTTNQPLKGSIMCFSPSRDFSSSTQQNITGEAMKNTLQISATMKNQSLAAHSYDVYMIIINEGVTTVEGGVNSRQTTSVSATNIGTEPQISYENYGKVAAENKAESGGSARTFFTGLWKKMQPVMKGVNAVLKDTKLLGKIAPVVPGLRYATPVIKSLGYGATPRRKPQRRIAMGEGGMFAAGDGGMMATGDGGSYYGDGDGGMYGVGDGGMVNRVQYPVKGSAYLKKTATRRY
jgi:hypothetical protein